MELPFWISVVINFIWDIFIVYEKWTLHAAVHHDHVGVGLCVVILGDADANSVVVISSVFLTENSEKIHDASVSTQVAGSFGNFEESDVGKIWGV